MKEAVSLLEAWYRRHARPLPWRKTRDPYAIWLSEVMLQQTQVATVIPYFERFLKTFPTLSALAAAPESQILVLWSGLGYYSRARNLHRGAKFIVQNHGGQFPRTREALLQVPGIGPYTAGAILSIAFDLREALVDGNVFRFLSRYLAFKHCIDTPKNQKFFWETTHAWVQQAGSPRILNQALMELGATVCTKAGPACPLCPLSSSCIANKKDLQNRLPIRKKRTRSVDLHWNLSIYSDKKRVFLVRNEKGAWWEGLWDFPRSEEQGTKEKKGVFLCRISHTVTHHKIQASAYLLDETPAPKNAKGRWFRIEEALRSPISSLSRKILLSIDT